MINSQLMPAVCFEDAGAISIDTGMNPNYVSSISIDISDILQFATMLYLYLLTCSVEARRNKKEDSQLRAFYSVSLK
jgi:hypothetical protein